jgi:hypothetical protein
MGHDPTLTAALSGQETAGRYVSPVDGVARLVASVPISETGWVAGADRAEAT